MTWSDSPINGQQDVATNKSPINNAFTYIANSMKVDHFWDNANSNLDGHHQFVQMPKNETGGVPANPAIATDMDGVFFCKDKTATEAPDLQIAEPFYIVNDGTRDQILQLGFRALVHFDSTGTIKYSHNVSSVNRTAEGRFTINFTTAMPTENYLVIAGGIRNTSDTNRVLAAGVQSSTSLASVMTTTSVKIIFSRNTANELKDPLRAWVAIIGG